MQSVPVQSWTFEQESVIRIGRSTNNHVILYSAVVSRHHVELRKADQGWEIVNLGANGTYLDGRRITQVPVQDGIIIRLARSGPNLQIHLGVQGTEAARGLLGEKTVGQVKPTTRLAGASVVDRAVDVLMEASFDPSQPPTQATLSEAGNFSLPPAPVTESLAPEITTPPGIHLNLSPCCQRYVESENSFCLECGKPLRAIATIGAYQVLKLIAERDVEITQLAWRDGQTFHLISINSEWVDHPEAAELFAQEAEHLLPINHPVLPHFVDRFVFKEQPYLVMQPVYGPSLQQSIQERGPLSMEAAIAIVLQVCDALNYLHHQPIPVIHQAISPATIVLRSGATQALTLAGLSPYRSLDISLHYNPAGYMAPEQKQSQAYPATDLYAIAPTLVYLLTGQDPSHFYAHREQGYRFYPEYVPGLPPDLIGILRRLTNPEPEERFDNAYELAQALTHWKGN
jgi:serine/threonine protein kinase